MKSDLFWLKDPMILINKDRLIEFVPTPDMTTQERLNAVTRFFVYAGVLLMIVYKNITMMYIPLILMALLYLINEHYEPLSQEGGTEQELQLPTEHNPFMNVLLTDYTENPQKKPASDIDNPKIKEEIAAKFNTGLYRDVDNIWETNNSQRQFYSTPSTTIPNDRDGFMKWCYNTPYNCKEGNISNCIYGARELSVTENTNGPTGPFPYIR